MFMFYVATFNAIQQIEFDAEQKRFHLQIYHKFNLLIRQNSIVKLLYQITIKKFIYFKLYKKRIWAACEPKYTAIT